MSGRQEGTAAPDVLRGWGQKILDHVKAGTDDIEAMRFKMILLSYLLRVPAQFGFQPWSPFQYGFFEGAFLDNPKFPELNKKIDELAAAYGVTNTAIAIAWISAGNFIVKMRNIIWVPVSVMVGRLARTGLPGFSVMMVSVFKIFFGFWVEERP
mgnify:CR=1 FL=1